jgi:hypothetical protein
MSQREDAGGRGRQVAEPAVVAALRKLIQDRRLTKEFLETDEFRALLSELRDATLQGSSLDVWSSLSVAGRAASVSKPMENVFFPIVDKRIDAGLPPFEVLPDGEDRWYLAKALQRNPSPEVVEIAFSEIVRDELGEKARRVWVEVGLAAAETREEFLKRINRNIHLLFGSPGERSDPLVRRIRRINSAISERVVTSDLPAGTEFSHQLRILYTGHLSEDGPDDRRLRDEAALELMASLTDVVRLSFAAASDPSSYFIAQDLRNWWQPASPPQEFESISRRLVRHGAEALHVFARQGLRNDALRKSLVAIGGSSLLDRVAREIVNRDSSLPEDLAGWFCTGEEPAKRHTSAAIEALSGERLDTDVSRLLVYVRSPEFDGAAIERIAADVSELMPDEGQLILQFSGRTKQVSQVMHSLAKRLHISLFLDTGEVVQFDPAQHDAINEGPIGANVLVVRPGTRKTEPGRTPIILLKPKVKHP